MKEADKIKSAIEDRWSVPPLPEGHEARFAHRLQRSKQQSRHRGMWLPFATFAAAASVLFAVFLWQGKGGANDTTDTLAMVKGYYASLIWEESEYIERITERMNPRDRENLLAEVKFIKQEADSIADNIIQALHDEDEKIHYMIVVYSSHLNSLKKLSAYLQPPTEK